MHFGSLYYFSVTKNTILIYFHREEEVIQRGSLFSLAVSNKSKTKKETENKKTSRTSPEKIKRNFNDNKKLEQRTHWQNQLNSKAKLPPLKKTTSENAKLCSNTVSSLYFKIKVKKPSHLLSHSHSRFSMTKIIT